MAFTWIEIYKEIAHRLLNYEDQQDKLISIIRRWSESGIKTIKLSDLDTENRSIALTQMDPFTFFANWNRGGFQNRTRILQELKSEWDLQSDIPSDYDGCPVAFPLASWFFLYKKDRDPDDVAYLWRLFTSAMGSMNLDATAFNHCVNVAGISKRATMGLFWVAPDRFLSLDSLMRQYFELHGPDISQGLENIDHSSYTSILKKVSDAYPERKLFELSHKAYQESEARKAAPPHPSVQPPKQTGQREPHYWLYAPGEGAYLWDDCYDGGFMAIGWDSIGDLKQYQSQEEIAAALRDARDRTGSQKNNALACYQFANVISIGDVIIAKRGRSEYLGYGEVVSDYYYDDSRKRYQKLRKVNWKKRGTWSETEHPIVMKTLTDITKYPDYVERLINLIIKEELVPEPGEYVQHPRNTILFGPPGTGKTYKTTMYAVAIIENKTESIISDEALEEYAAVKRRFDEYVEQGRIVFVSFHQSYSYEEFVEGIKPYVISDTNQVAYRVEGGIFKRMCTDALYDIYVKSRARRAKEPDFKDRYIQYLEHLRANLRQANPFSIQSKTGAELHIIDVNNNDTIVMTSPGGMRNYAVSKNRMQRLYKAFPKADTMHDIAGDIREAIGGCNATMYWAILRDLNRFEESDVRTEAPEIEITEDIDRETKERLTTGFSLEEYGSLDQSKADRFVLVIDEINRGNVASVFGELITLIEDNKRIGMPEATTTVLPYSKKSFGVPSNIYIIGTMNTADRSVEALDTALRRRFSFVRIAPDPDTIKPVENLNVEIPLMLKVINDRLERLLDADHLIGHAYFMDLETSADPFEELKHIFANKVVPLLQEFFYNDPVKLGMILGEQFIKKRDVFEENALVFGAGFGDESGDFEEKTLYETADPLTFENDTPFRSIYENDAEDAADL